MKMALPAFIPTLCAHSMGNHTRVNNIFCSKGLLDTITKCYTNDAKHPVKTDHYPIITALDVHMLKTELLLRYNFHKMNWPEFLSTLKSKLEEILQSAPINDINTFNLKLKALNMSIWDVINIHLEVSKLTPYSKRWWSTNLAKDRKATIKLARKAKQFWDHPDHPIHEAHHLQRNKYADYIKKAKADHWVDWLEDLNESSIWQAANFISSLPTDAAKTRLPSLQVIDPATKCTTKVAHTNKDKSQLMHATFFPPTNPDLPPPKEKFQYLPPGWSFNKISDLIGRVIDNLKPYKATMTGTVSNTVLEFAKDLLVPFLSPIYRATNSLKYYPPAWSLTKNLVLKKPSKTNYTIPSAWQPIVLEEVLQFHGHSIGLLEWNLWP